MMKKSRLAVLLAVLLALVCAPALATELSSSLDDFQAALSAEEVQAELVYQQLMACTTLKDMHDTMNAEENREGMYTLNEAQLNGVNTHAVQMCADLKDPTPDDMEYYDLITETAQVLAEDNGVELLATPTQVERRNSGGVTQNWYSNLSSAVTAASNGDIILVHESFTETVSVKIHNKQNLTIRAADGKTPKISWSGTLEAIGVSNATSYHCVVIYTSVTTSTTFGGGTGTLTLDASGSASDAQKGKRARVMAHCGSGTLNIKDGIVLTGGRPGGGTYTSGKAEGGKPVGSGEITGTTGNGAGIFMSDGTLNMNGGRIHDNYSLWGTSTTHNYVGGGGGVYLDRTSKMNFSGGIIEHNAAGSGGGGGILVGGKATLTMTGGTLKENVTRFASGGGIGIIVGAVVKVQGGTIMNNFAEGHGGGLFARGDSIPLELTGGKFIGNTAGSYGGGILFWTVGDDITRNAVIIGGNVEIRGNHALYGGGVCVGREVLDGKPIGSKAKLVIKENAVISGNTAEVLGGGIWMQSDEFSTAVNTVEISGGTISGNSAKEGGGIYVPGGTVTMTGGTFSQNTATEDGAALFTGGGTFTMSAGTFSANEAEDNGGGVFVQGGQVVIKGGSLTRNSADNGGAVYMAGIGSFTMSNGVITDNTAVNAGGAVFLTSGNFVMQHGEVNSNSANQGGAVYMGGGAGTTFMMQSGQMNNNTASDDGGAIYAMGGTLYIGLQDCQGSEVNVDKEGNVTITDEKAAAHKELHNCNVADCSHPEITGNEAGDCGGAIAIAKSENGNTAGTVRFYCGNAIGNKAHYKGVGMNVFMDGGDFWYYNGANVGVPREPDLVIVGGKLHNETDGEGAMVNLHYYVSNIVSAEPDMVGLAHPNEWITLPDAEYFWASEKPENTRFFGWTAQGVDSGENSKFVRSTKDYVPSGTSVEVLDAAKNSDDEDQPIWDGNDKDNTIHLYALWAPETSQITYVERSRDYDDRDTETYNYNSGISLTQEYKIDDETQTLTFNPTKPGYQVTGWYIYQNENQNANWGYEPVYVENAANNDYENLDYEKLTQAVTKNDDGSLSLTVPLLTFGDITLIAEWEELEAEITYVAVSPSAEIGGWVDGTVNGRITWTQKMGQATGKPANGSALANTPNYKFVGWYSDDKCSALIGNEAVYTPEKVNSLNVSATYYAKFEYDVADLIITATGLSANDSAVFTVVGYNASNQKKTWTISLQNGTAIISDMKIGSEYTITVNDDWSVYYTSAVSQDNQNTIVPVTDENNPNEQTITLTANTDKWLHDESARENWNQ